jgi:predicted kinase
MPTAYILVGVPCSGKSTWVRDQDWSSECVYVSTDQFVEHYAQEVGRTYREVFEEYMPTAVDLMTKRVVWAREQGRDVIWDQTSTTQSSRAKKFRMLPGYHMIAVVFGTPEPAELAVRLNSRPGKEIPSDVMLQMISNYEKPTEMEGFDEIWFG